MSGLGRAVKPKTGAFSLFPVRVSKIFAAAELRIRIFK